MQSSLVKFSGGTVFPFVGVILNQFLVRKMDTGHISQLMTLPILLICQWTLSLQISILYRVWILKIISSENSTPYGKFNQLTIVYGNLDIKKGPGASYQVNGYPYTVLQKGCRHDPDLNFNLTWPSELHFKTLSSNLTVKTQISGICL